jgi:hypothetical protein
VARHRGDPDLLKLLRDTDIEGVIGPAQAGGIGAPAGLLAGAGAGKSGAHRTMVRIQDCIHNVEGMRHALKNVKDIPAATLRRLERKLDDIVANLNEPRNPKKVSAYVDAALGLLSVALAVLPILYPIVLGQSKYIAAVFAHYLRIALFTLAITSRPLAGAAQWREIFKLRHAYKVVLGLGYGVPSALALTKGPEERQALIDMMNEPRYTAAMTIVGVATLMTLLKYKPMYKTLLAAPASKLAQKANGRTPTVRNLHLPAAA